jgi:hypothetical protein
MPDPRSGPGDPTPEPEGAIEAGELRRRHEEEFRRERERRAADSTPEPPHEAGPDVQWKPPAELASARTRRTYLRVLLFLLVVAALYFVIRFLTEMLFAPKLTLLSPALPAGAVSPNTPVTIGVYARNDRRREGAAYALLLLPDGSEVEGPVVVVPAGDSVLVPVQAAFPPGDHVTSLVLYDAWRENVEVGALHGLLIRSGMVQTDVAEATLLPVAQAADSIVLEFVLANRTEFDAAVVPVVVFTPESGAGQPLEVSLQRVVVPAGQTLARREAIRPGTVPVGRYLVSVVNITDSGERTGSGIHGVPFALPSQGAPVQR